MREDHKSAVESLYSCVKWIRKKLRTAQREQSQQTMERKNNVFVSSDRMERQRNTKKFEGMLLSNHNRG